MQDMEDSRVQTSKFSVNSHMDATLTNTRHYEAVTRRFCTKEHDSGEQKLWPKGTVKELEHSNFKQMYLLIDLHLLSI